MKRFLYLILFIVIANTCMSQREVQTVAHYIFPEFSKGTVLMKNGTINDARLNYNSLTEEMIFDNKGTKLALQPELVDTVFINGRRFFTLNGKFVELVYKSKYILYAEYRCNIKEPGTPSGYGGTSETSATTSYSSFLSSSGWAYDLQLPVGIGTKPYILYWLGKDGTRSKFISVRQLSKLFTDKENKVKEYLKKNDVKFDNQESIIGLLKFLEKE
jgi:hypothetical protein